MKWVTRILRYLFTVFMLCMIYFETGIYTTALLALIVFTQEITTVLAVENEKLSSVIVEKLKDLYA